MSVRGPDRIVQDRISRDRIVQDRIVQDRIVAAARAWIGTPYRHQASVKGVGCDCLGAEPEAAPPYAASWAESAAPGTDPLAQAAGRHLVPAPLGDSRGPPDHPKGEDLQTGDLRTGDLQTGDLQAGDVLLFAFRAHLPARHCAIVANRDGGRATMIHAHDGAVVTEVALTRWWRRHCTHAFRFPDRIRAVAGSPEQAFDAEPVPTRPA